MNHFETTLEKIKTIRLELLQHPLYGSITTIEHLQIFMQHHVFAVWDFMSLLKKMQFVLTRTTEPWYVVGNGDVRYFINQIVLGEESDLDEEGNRISHFELYLKAMFNAGANVYEINSFYENIRNNIGVYSSLDLSVRNDACREFVKSTFDMIRNGDIAAVCGAFTFGREDLIPDMFQSIVENISLQNDGRLNAFLYYINRHIEIDGGEHKHLAHKLMEHVCGNDESKWNNASNAALKSLESRIKLWDSVHYEISKM
jgi:hypothetical protein